MILRVALKFSIPQTDLDSGRVDLARIALLEDYLSMEADNDMRIERWRQANEH
ncbi:hypothetical protein TUM12370_18040 [Salmonella enterica subsp. enterica serovar Choleraesuis]|nr:hypothetical protein TUM12370_18040 [Salmonella enterica subsp. enterica serovar Choleraesuis]